MLCSLQGKKEVAVASKKPKAPKKVRSEDYDFSVALNDMELKRVKMRYEADKAAHAATASLGQEGKMLVWVSNVRLGGPDFLLDGKEGGEKWRYPHRSEARCENDEREVLISEDEYNRLVQEDVRDRHGKLVLAHIIIPRRNRYTRPCQGGKTGPCIYNPPRPHKPKFRNMGGQDGEFNLVLLQPRCCRSGGKSDLRNRTIDVKVF